MRYARLKASVTPIRNKFGNVPTAGKASKREAKRARELKLLQKAGKITELREQVPFLLIPAQFENGKCVERSCTYVADFSYFEGGQFVVEDSKGYRDRVYRQKRKLMLFFHKIRIRET